jgi:hypothetical protein
MSGIRSNLAPRNCKPGPFYGWRFLFLLSILVAGSLGAPWALRAGPVAIIQPAFYHQPSQQPIRDSIKTVVAYYDLDPEGLTPCPATDEQGARTRAIAAQDAARQLAATLRPEVVRDAKGVLSALQFHSPNVALSSILLLPETWNRYSQALGPDCLAAVPNRETLLLFPRLGGNLRSFSVEALARYRNHPYPGSTEVLEWRNGALRAVHDFTADLVE